MDDESRQIAQERLKRTLQQAPTTREVVWEQLKAGTDPAYLAVRYNMDLERLLRAKAELDRREAQKRG